MRRLFFHFKNKKEKARFDPGNLMLLIYVTLVLFFLLFGGFSHVRAEECRLKVISEAVIFAAAEKSISN